LPVSVEIFSSRPALRTPWLDRLGLSQRWREFVEAMPATVGGVPGTSVGTLLGTSLAASVGGALVGAFLGTLVQEVIASRAFTARAVATGLAALFVAIVTVVLFGPPSP
jgi:uncharacterized protein YqgC (DUF456 family)